MHSSSDFEKLWFLYKTEGEPQGILINSFCLTQGVPYRDFNNWFVKTRKKIVPIQIEGIPSSNSFVDESSAGAFQFETDINMNFGLPNVLEVGKPLELK